MTSGSRSATGPREQTLKASDKAVIEVAERWEQFVEYVSLELRQSLGRPVAPAWPRKSDRHTRTIEAARDLAQDGILRAAIKIPDAAAPLDIEANLRTREFTTSFDLAAPREGRAKGRIGWFLRRTKEMPADLLRLEVKYPNAREATAAKLTVAMEHPERMLYAPDPKRDPRGFQLSHVAPLGRKRGRGPGSFVGDSRKQLHDFYRDVLQRVRAWQPPAPRLKDTKETAEQRLDEPIAVGAVTPQESDSDPI